MTTMTQPMNDMSSLFPALTSFGHAPARWESGAFLSCSERLSLLSDCEFDTRRLPASAVLMDLASDGIPAGALPLLAGSGMAFEGDMLLMASFARVPLEATAFSAALFIVSGARAMPAMCDTSRVRIAISPADASPARLRFLLDRLFWLSEKAGLIGGLAPASEFRAATGSPPSLGRAGSADLEWPAVLARLFAEEFGPAL